MADHLWLIGMMGSGKSTVGRAVADRRGAPFSDTDVDVERAAGRTVPELWGQEGEEAFREAEARVVAELAGATSPHVIATGGGVVLRDENVTAMRSSGCVAWLAAEAAELAERLGDDAAGRPLIAAGPTAALPVVTERLRAILDERCRLYEAAADQRVETMGRSVDEIVDALEACWPVT